MHATDHILKKWNVDPTKKSPIEIVGMRRDDLGELFKELNFKTGAEIGVEQGIFAETLLKANPELQLYAIDSWKAYSDYREYITQSHLDNFFKDAQERLKPYAKRCTVIRKNSIDACRDFPDESLDFVYIDANHTFPYVVADIDGWSKKVRRGGIIAGHDYIMRDRPTFTHVIQAVNGYTDSFRIKPWFLIGARDKKLDVGRDKSRSWMWVKK